MSDTILDTFIQVLNEAWEADPAAIHSLIVNQVPCNQALADHPTIVVESHPVAGPDEYTSAGMLGVINGICHALTGRDVAVMWTDPPDEHGRRQITGFCAYNPVVMNNEA